MEILLNPLFLCVLFVGIVSIVIGYYMKKHPPKRINGIYGYRTPSSMRNQERWDFAQKHSACQMLITGKYLCLLAGVGLVVLWFVFISIPVSLIIAVVIVILWVFFLIVSTERAIKKKFEKDY